MYFSQFSSRLDSEMNEQSNGYELVAALFLRLLALIFLSAFISLSSQIEGLAGSQGILPISYALEGHLQHWGNMAWWHFPTLFWLNSSDTALTGAAYIGAIASVVLFFNVFPRLSLIVMLLMYLSLYHAGQTFMNFQWDILLLESGFLSLFLCGNSRYVIWLFRWLLFRLRFLSGISKIVSQDPTWLGLTAVTYYFEVQPLPNQLSWYAHQLPETLLIAAAGITLFIEIVVPFMMFLPRKYRFTAAWLTIMMQVIIMLTSNHNWFNLLTLALCLFLFDDRALRKILPLNLVSWLLNQPLPVKKGGRFYQSGMQLLSAFIIFVSSVQMFEMFSQKKVDGIIGELAGSVKQLAIVNKYHVFPTMRTERHELLIYGSIDGRQWQEYKFRYKPDDTTSAPGVVIPHHPRLDWLMWFVTLHPHFLPWFEAFLVSLLEGSPAVNDLLLENPFPDSKPNIIRVDLYRYQFTDPQTRRETGQWWQREYLGLFPPLPYIDSFEQ